MEKSDQVRSDIQTDQTFRIGLLVDSTWASKYTFDFAKWAAGHQKLKITHLIIHAPKVVGYPKSIMFLLTNSLKSLQSPKLMNWLALLDKFVRNYGIWSGLYEVLSRVFFAVIIKTEGQLLRVNDRHKDHLDSFDLSSLIPDLITISPIVSRSGFVYRFDPTDVRKVRDLNLDLLIRCGGGILRGDILRASRLGIISFHHADNRINRGGPAGFWEAYLRQDTTGFTIQWLTEELDGGHVLMRGHFRTYWHFLLNQAVLYQKSNYYLKLLIDKIVHMGKLPPPVRNTPYANKLFRSPRMREAMIYMIKLGWRLAKRSLKRIFGVDYRWRVAFVKSDWPNAVLWRGTELKIPPLHFLADPFVISSGGQDFCFVEEYDYQEQRGKIAVYDVSDCTRIGTALEESFHLSFPFLFHYNNQLFMCPETHQKKEIRIYRCIAFPLRWTLEKIIMRNIVAADTMLVEKGDKWWMFTNIDPTDSGDFCSELFIFFAESPFADDWTPHPLNPIFVDASCARNGGLIMDGQSLFRVSQGQAFDFYGKQSRINEIVRLTENDYNEICIGEVTPNFGEGILGTHHLHSNGKITVFDFVSLSRGKGPKDWARLFAGLRRRMPRRQGSC